MQAPTFTLTDPQNNAISVMNFGVVDAGNQSGGFAVRVWNNQSQAANIADANNTTITTKTLNGFDNGDSVPNGEEIVTFTMIQVQCSSTGETAYSPIGGPQTHPIGYQPPVSGGITSIPSKQFAQSLLRAAIPQTATPGNINFLIRVNYQYA
jgi:hypothetical protein